MENLKSITTGLMLTIAAMVMMASSTRAATLTYDFHLNTPQGAPMTQIVLYAKGVGQDDVYLSPVELPASGVFH